MSKQITPISIIIPTFDNPVMLSNCVRSMAATRLMYPFKLIVVNNGHPQSLAALQGTEWLKIIQTGGKNLGWEGGLKEGLKHVTTEFVMFANDDIYIPASEAYWLRKMIELFIEDKIGAVGPISNVVAGSQNMYFSTPHMRLEATYLIGFCVLLRKKALDEAGGIDDTLSGGDDLDLSIRLRQKGYRLIVDRETFVYHHGFVTGNKIYGDASKKNGWNSPLMSENTNMGLIRKHGFKTWYETIAGVTHVKVTKGPDHEGDAIRKYVTGEKVIELGCGDQKTVPHAVGVDRVAMNQKVPLLNATSRADIVADVEEPLPFETNSQDVVIARHILEHCVDLIATLTEWIRIIKPKGRLIIAVPDEKWTHTIPINAEHVHAFTVDSIAHLGQAMGLTLIEALNPLAGSGVIAVFEKGE